MTQVFTGDGVTYFTLASQKMQLGLEAKGLTSSGGALRPRLAAQHGLKPRDSREKFIAVIQAKMDAILELQEKEQALEHYGYRLELRDPKVKPDLEGAWMITDTDDSDEGFAIVGNDKGELIREAVAMLLEEVK